MNDVVKTVSDANNEKNRTREWLDAHSDTSPDLGGGLANSEDDQGIAARLYLLCLRVLRQMCRQEQYKSSSGNSTSMLKEEVGKLYLWGEAFRDGKLDRALEYSDEVRSNVLESLGDIGRLLLREAWPSSISIPESSSSQKPIQELKYLVEQARAIASSKDSLVTGSAGVEEGGSDTDDDDISEDDVTGDIYEELGLHTRWLTQLAPTLEQNLIHAENARYQTSCRRGAPFLVSGPAAIYVSLVREKYRQAQNQLVERLGEANWQRHVKVRTRMEASVDVPSPAEELVVAKSLFRPYSAFHDSGIGTSVQGQTQYASSFQSSNREGEHESLRVPATPAEVYDGKPFQCFLCKSMLSNIKNRDDWKMHIFSDLQPYICTFTECGDEMAQFPSRAAWAEHEFSNHRTTQSWTCPECAKDFLEVSTWEKHLQEIHRLFFSCSNLQVAKDMALKTEARQIEDDECPLCRIVVGKPRRGFVKHVGRHMEEIALMALPRDVEEDTEEGSLSTDHTSLEKSSQNFHSKFPTETDREEAALGKGIEEDEVTYSLKIQSWHHPDINGLNGSQFYHLQHLQRKYNVTVQSAHPTPALAFEPPVCDNVIVRGPKEGADRAREELLTLPPWIVEHPTVSPAQVFKNYDMTEEALAGDNFPRTGKAENAAGTKMKTFMNEADNERSQLQTHEGAGAHIEILEGSGGFANSDLMTLRGGVAPPRRCQSCNRVETPLWRDGDRTLCNACGLHYAQLTREKCSTEGRAAPQQQETASFDEGVDDNCPPPFNSDLNNPDILENFDFENFLQTEEDTEKGSTLPSDRQVPTQNVPHLEQPKSRFSLQKSAPANVSDNPIMVCANEDDANNGLIKKRKRKLRLVKPRKPRTLTNEGKAHAKMAKECPGGACADCKRRKNKCTHNLPEDMRTPNTPWTEPPTPDYGLGQQDFISYRLPQKNDTDYEEID